MTASSRVCLHLWVEGSFLIVHVSSGGRCDVKGHFSVRLFCLSGAYHLPGVEQIMMMLTKTDRVSVALIVDVLLYDSFQAWEDFQVF